MKTSKTVLFVIVVVAILFTGMLFGISASAGTSKYIEVVGFDPKIDYMHEIKAALDDGSVYAMQMGAIYEQQRNLKIETLKAKQAKTSYFEKYSTPTEIKTAILNDNTSKPTATPTPAPISTPFPTPTAMPTPGPTPKYTQSDLDLLARIIYAEVGCTWIPDWVQLATGSVVLNRVKSSKYPNTIRDVVYQKGQYGPPSKQTPDSRTFANAKYLLESGSTIPANVLGQNGSATGNGIWKSYYDSVLHTTVYFTYG